MGFESFTVILSPGASSPLRGGQSAADVRRVADDIRRHCPNINRDRPEQEGQEYSPRPGDEFLVYDAADGLFQLRLGLYESQVGCSLRFALCNPRTVYGPFIAVTAWLMRRYQMDCRILSDTPGRGVPNEVPDHEGLASALTPGMDYNKKLWHMDAGKEEARLRPGEAISRYILLSGVPA